MDRAVRLIVLFAAMMLAIFFVVVPTAGAASTAKVAGEWTLEVQTPNGTAAPSVVFQQDGENLTGTYKGRTGESPVKGTIHENDIKFSTTISRQGQDIVLEYSATVDGDTMKGSAKFGQYGEANFTGKKKPAETPASK